MTDFPAVGMWGPGMSAGPCSQASPVSDMMAITNWAATVSAVWPTANLALFFPFLLDEPRLVQHISHVNGTVVSGNVDVGVYDRNGARLVSKGTTAQAGVSTIQTHDVTDTLLAAGLYYAAMVLDNVTGTVARAQPGGVPGQAAAGAYQMATAFVLPATATFALPAVSYVPSLAVHFAATI